MEGLFNKIDNDHDEKITFDEFFAALKQHDEKKPIVKQVFDYIDLDKSGDISLMELTASLKDPEVWF